MKMIHPLLCAAALAGASCANAATFTVSSLADNGTGTLREAIALANQTAEADTIMFQDRLTGTITLASGEIPITNSVSILGTGAAKITINANNASRVFRIDNNGGPDKVFLISGLTLTGGRASSGNVDSGGAVFYEQSTVHAQITLRDLVLSANTAGRKGGAVSIAGANVRLDNVQMNGNRAQGGFQPSGGALYFNRGSIVIERSRFINNVADLSGGAIEFASPGVFATISDTTIEGNSASLEGGGIDASVQNLKLSRSTIANNTVGQPNGGGIFMMGATDANSPENIIENSTFSGNVATHQSGGGSALAVWQGNMTVRNVTFAFNKTAPAVSPGANAGGALWVNVGGTTRVKVQNSLFNENTHGNSNQPVDLMRKIGTPESVLEVDHSLFEVTPVIGVITTGNANIEANALLKPLTLSDGGLTALHPIPANSPAVDAGATPANLATDQRGAGFVRTIDSICRRPRVDRTDIGAYEYRADTIFCYAHEN